LGVAKGEFSETLLRSANVSLLFSIDRWADHHDEKEMQLARKRLQKFGPRCRIIHKTFADALRHFKNESLDFIYIDGYAHTGQEGGRTLRDWFPKLKPGGLFAGHDYHTQFPETIKAVDTFAAANKLTLKFTEEKPPMHWPSWYCFKPKYVNI